MGAQAPEGGQAASAEAGGYVLGPNDKIDITVLDAEEMSGQGLRVGSDGFINLPLVGRVQVAGLTAEGTEQVLRNKLSVYLRDPHVTVAVLEFQSQPVTVLGEVVSPGVHHLQGEMTLAELLSTAGGVKETAGPWIKITRRIEEGPIPLASSEADPAGRFYVAEVRLEEITEALNPEHNVTIKPHDLVSVPKADLIYVMGSVRQTGGFRVVDRRGVSVIQALAMAGGLDKNAAKKDSRIMRPSGTDGQYQEIGLDLKAILAGKEADQYLRKDDVLFIPKNGGKAFASQAAQALVRVGTGVAIVAGN